MPKHFKVFRQMVLGYILIVGLSVGLITPIAQAEAPADTSYNATPVLVDGMTQAQRAAKIDEFYTERGNLPLDGYGMTMVQDADKYGVNWELLPALAYNESTAGAQECPPKHGVKSYNDFGYNSCATSFTSYADEINTVSMDLAGDIPATAKFYQGKSIDQIIDTYNPPSANPDYKDNVLWTMNKIATIDVPSNVAVASTSSNGQLAINN